LERSRRSDCVRYPGAFGHQSEDFFCSSSHQLLIIRISLRIFECIGFPLSSSWSYYTCGRTPLDVSSANRKDIYLYRTRQHRNTKTNIHALSGIRTHDPSHQATKTYFLDRAATGNGHCRGNDHVLSDYVSGTISL
jgi:hypothetical protein